MNKLLLIISFIFLFAGSAFATPVTVSSTQIRNWQAKGTKCFLRIYASDSFTASDGIRYIGGAAGSPNYFQVIEGTVAGTVCSIPSFTLPSTVDSIDLPQVRYTAAVYDQTGAPRGKYLTDFFVPVTTPTTWAAIIQANAGTPAALSNLFYTATAIDQMLAGLSTAPKASDVIFGKVTTSVPPTDATNPKVVGVNDPVVTKEFVAASSADYVSRITAIGTTKATLVVSGAMDVDTITGMDGGDITIPENVTLRFTNDGYFTTTTGGIITFAGKIEAPRRNIFRGSGTVVFTSTPDKIYPEWFGVVSTSIGAAAPSSAVQTANVTGINKAIDSTQSVNYFLQLTGYGGTFSFEASRKYYFNSMIDLSKTTGIIFTSSSRASASLVYTASGTGIFVELGSAQRFLAENIEFLYTSTTYTGKLVKVGNSSDWESVPVYIDFLRCNFAGFGAANQADALLWMHTPNIASVRDSRFGNGKVGVLGRIDGYLSSNIVDVSGNVFYVSEAATKNPYQTWTIEKNTVEGYDSNSQMLVVTTDGLAAYALTVRDNWIGDVVSDKNSHIIDVLTYGGSIENNNLFGFGAETKAAIRLQGGTSGVVVSGNEVLVPKFIEFGAICYGVTVSANNINQLGTPIVNRANAVGLTVIGHYVLDNYFERPTEFSYPVSAVGGLKIGASGTTTTLMARGTVSITPPAIAASSIVNTTIAIAGVAVGDTIQLNPPADGTGTNAVTSFIRVSAAGEVTITWFNPTVVATGAGSAGVWTYAVTR